MAAESRRHEAEVAAEVRHQNRIEVAYLHVLEIVNQAWALMERDKPTRDEIDYQALDDRVVTILAELDAFGSDEVKEIFDRWRAAWGLFKIDVHNARIRSGETVGHGLDVLEGDRSEGRTAAKDLAAQIGVELGRGREQRPWS